MWLSHISNTRFSSPLRPNNLLKVDLYEYRSTSTFRGEFISAIEFSLRQVLKKLQRFKVFFCPDFSHFCSFLTVLISIYFALLPQTPHRLIMHGNSLISMSISYRTAKRGIHMDFGAFSEGQQSCCLLEGSRVEFNLSYLRLCP